MAVHQYLRYAMCVALRLLKHGELVGIADAIVVHACLDVPAREVSAIGAGKRARAEAAHGRALPIAVVDVVAVAPDAGIVERQADGATPRRFGDLLRVAGSEYPRGERQGERRKSQKMLAQICLRISELRSLSSFLRIPSKAALKLKWNMGNYRCQAIPARSFTVGKQFIATGMDGSGQLRLGNSLLGALG